MERPQSGSLSGYCASTKASQERLSPTSSGVTEWLIDSLFLKRSMTSQYANNRCELSHEPIRVRVRGMRKFKSMHQAQRFLGAHAAVYNLFNLGRHLVSAENYRFSRQRAFVSWASAVAMKRGFDGNFREFRELTCQYL